MSVGPFLPQKRGNGPAFHVSPWERKENLKEMSLNFAAMEKYAIYFQQGVLYTVVLSFFTVAFGFVIALVWLLSVLPNRAACTGSKIVVGILQTFAKLYVEFIRGTPMLVQLYLMFYVVFGTMGLKAPQFTLFGFVQGDRLIPGIIALSLNSGAYVSEIIRAGIQGIDYGQTEAARSLGMTAAQNMRYIVLPQAIKNILPAIANEFVTHHQGILHLLGAGNAGADVQRQAGAGRVLPAGRAAGDRHHSVSLPDCAYIQSHSVFREEDEPWADKR